MHLAPTQDEGRSRSVVSIIQYLRVPVQRGKRPSVDRSSAEPEEIWTQNGVSSPADRLASVRGILRGESLSTFNTSIEENWNAIDENGVLMMVPLSVEGVFAVIQSIAETVFPFKALVNQKLWMRKVLKKPKELLFRKTMSAVGGLNNSLPLFPKGSVADKFSAAEILEILEWSIPGSWRQKFDSLGYTPSEHGKARLLTECEIIERNEPKPTKPVVTTKSTGNREKSQKMAYVSMAVQSLPKRQDSTVPSMVKILLIILLAVMY